jgi:hypothetical protein
LVFSRMVCVIAFSFSALSIGGYGIFVQGGFNLNDGGPRRILA